MASGCSGLRNIVIPSNVKGIGSNSFNGCTNLSSVTYETSALTAIGGYAFYQDYALHDLNVPGTVKSIGDYAFRDCYSAYASALVLPSALTSIGTYAYWNCYSLKELEIPSGLTAIGNYALAGCRALSSIIDRRLTAQTVGADTFGDATGTGNTAYTGYNTRGSNVLCAYAAAEGYDTGYWLDPLQNADKCGFNMQYIDPENLRYCEITFNAGDGTVDTPTKTYVQGKTIRELPTVTCPASTPYFGGWWTEQGGTGIKYSTTSRAPNQDTLTLYALYGTTPF